MHRQNRLGLERPFSSRHLDRVRRPDLLPEDRHVAWGLDADPDAIAADGDDGNADVVVNYDGFVRLAA